MQRPAGSKGMSWGRLAAMVVVSTGLMFVLMYQLVYAFDHATFSLNRLIAALVMACVMTVVMLAFMWSMYEGETTKIAIVGIATVLGIALLLVNRYQAVIDDARFLASMIPHHSIAINNARRAHIGDPRVRRLADGIIESQMVEIAAMKLLLAELRRSGADIDADLPARPAALTPDMVTRAREMAR